MECVAHTTSKYKKKKKDRSEVQLVNRICFAHSTTKIIKSDFILKGPLPNSMDQGEVGQTGSDLGH